MCDELKLDALPADFRRKHADAIAVGHCNLLRAEELPARARAQIARDIIMAQMIRPYLNRGGVLLAGNGHVRRDIGVPFCWLLMRRAMRLALACWNVPMRARRPKMSRTSHSFTLGARGTKQSR
jgi:hypothetical protein